MTFWTFEIVLRYLQFIIPALLVGMAGATVSTVSNTDPAATIYNRIQNARCGDTVRITGGHYTLGRGLVRIYLTRKKCDAGNPLTIQAYNGTPVFDYSAHPLSNHKTLPCDSIPGTYNSGGDCDRGAWQLWNNSHVIIDGIHWKGVTSLDSENAAALRLVGTAFRTPSDHITIKNCIIELSYNGVQMSGGHNTNTVFDHDQFINNGNSSNEQEHQLYDGGGDNTTVRYSYFDASGCCIKTDGTINPTGSGGQNLHLRSFHTYLYGNWIANAKQYEFDMMTPNKSYDPGDHVMHGYIYGNVIISAANPASSAKVVTVLDDVRAFNGGTFYWHFAWNTIFTQSSTCYQGNSGKIPPNTTDQCSFFQINNQGYYTDAHGISGPSVSKGIKIDFSNNVMFMTKRPDDASARSLFLVSWGTNPPCINCNASYGPLPWSINGNNNTFDNHMINTCSTPQTYAASNGTCSLTNNQNFAYASPPFTNARDFNFMPTSAGAFGKADTTIELPYPLDYMQTSPMTFVARTSFADRGALQVVVDSRKETR